MAAVIIPSEDNSYFSNNMRRSHSQPKFVSRQASFPSAASPNRKPDGYVNNPRIYPDSAPSSVSSSPRIAPGDSEDLSYASTPSTNLSLDCDETMQLPTHPDEHFGMPHYSRASFYDSAEDLEPPTSPKTGDSYTVSPAEQDNSADTSRPGTPEFILEVDAPSQDDTAVKTQPTRHVDYLSHEWKEEDIWSSWRYIVSRRSEVTNSARLENASWRTWVKAKNNLKTVSPEALNWLKDCDVTWLYGPLQTGGNALAEDGSPQNSAILSKNDSFINKKPILKKRSMSEVMLQRSLSASSLVKTAAAAVQAQEKEGGRKILRPALSRAATDYVTFPFSSRRLSRESFSLGASSSTSGAISPNVEKRHIHFNEQVEQCIALDVKGEEDEEEIEADPLDDSDSSDGAIMMKRTKPKKRLPLKRKKSKHAAAAAESKTIAMLPSTTLKYREDTPEPTETAMKHSVRSPLVSPSSSQETLRPSRASGRFFFEDEDEEAEEAMLSPRPGLQSPDDTGFGLQRSASTNSLNAEPAGMRRTSSGMFMPYEEGESSTSDGIFGRVVDTVNTARDIAHVIWNVGWRK
ncbi:protein phosphatase type 1 complex subunit Hex2/Reg1 [Plectosphaerella cucumerina]|uniref:Protein phosphatase type 1 complex subunit Hex2/Reg1 n=1 Tax=Plectosphaerella cucumerina TaxID=40658 RepID=A0A8K0TBT2_9PEZI|nr:protein phosphatase type 1 complex subunit Hex2/Reg1 [Plectosphaerella cucumerina]